MAKENLTRAALEAGDITRAVLTANPSKEADALLVFHSLGLFRIIVEEDKHSTFADLCGDSFSPEVNPEIPAEQLRKEREQFRSRVRRMGVWGAIAQVRAKTTDKWDEPPVTHREVWSEHYQQNCTVASGTSSIWGFVGGEFIGSGYEADMMDTAHKWLTTGNVEDAAYGLYVQTFWASSVLGELADKVENEEHARTLRLVASRLAEYRSKVAKG